MVADHVLQRHPVKKLHSDERLTILFADVMNSANVRVIQCRCGLGFALKTGECLRVTRNFFRQEFEGDEAMQPRILGLIHNAHSPATELFNNAVVRDGSPDHSQECYGGWRVMSMRFGSRYFSFSYSA